MITNMPEFIERIEEAGNTAVTSLEVPHSFLALVDQLSEEEDLKETYFNRYAQVPSNSLVNYVKRMEDHLKMISEKIEQLELDEEDLDSLARVYIAALVVSNIDAANPDPIESELQAAFIADALANMVLEEQFSQPAIDNEVRMSTGQKIKHLLKRFLLGQ